MEYRKESKRREFRFRREHRVGPTERVVDVTRVRAKTKRVVKFKHALILALACLSTWQLAKNEKVLPSLQRLPSLNIHVQVPSPTSPDEKHAETTFVIPRPQRSDWSVTTARRPAPTISSDGGMIVWSKTLPELQNEQHLIVLLLKSPSLLKTFKVSDDTALVVIRAEDAKLLHEIIPSWNSLASVGTEASAFQLDARRADDQGQARFAGMKLDDRALNNFGASATVQNPTRRPFIGEVTVLPPSSGTAPQLDGPRVGKDGFLISWHP